MKIGLVVTCRDGWEYTEAALKTVKSEHEIFQVVVDDGSTDGTKAGLKKWRAKDTQNRRILKDPPYDSLAGKWNAGVRTCLQEGCEFVLISNNDVLYHPLTIDRLVSRMEAGGVVMATGHDVGGMFRDNNWDPLGITDEQFQVEDDLGEQECPDFSCFMLNRECWDTIGPFDERFAPAYFEDNDYHERIVREGLKAVNVRSAVYYHYGSVTRNLDQTPDPDKDRRFEATRDQYFIKWGFIPHGDAKVSKIKLLLIGDGDQPTGFARVNHEVARYLHSTGDYDIHHLAINYHGDPTSEPWQMYPAHLSDPPDMFGRGRVRDLYNELKPDAVLMVQDPWHVADYISSLVGMRGLTAYYPVDSPNLNPTWMAHMSRCVEVCTYTQFGADESAQACALALSRYGQQTMHDYPDKDVIPAPWWITPRTKWSDNGFMLPTWRMAELSDASKYNVIPHGVDIGDFHPLDRDQCRAEYSIPRGAFVVGYVHRNQPRKRQDAMIRAFAKFVKDVRDGDSPEIHSIRDAPVKRKNCVLVVHSPLDEVAGWDLPALAVAYGIRPMVYFTKPGVRGALTIEGLNQLYNTFDVNCNVGGGEGWGLSHIESAACGIAQIVPNWSATAEIWKDAALLADIAEIQHADYHLNTMQACVSTDHVADLLERLHEDADMLAAYAEKAHDLAHRPEYRWESVGARFDEVLKRAATQKGVPHHGFEFSRKGAA